MGVQRALMVLLIVVRAGMQIFLWKSAPSTICSTATDSTKAHLLLPQGHFLATLLDSTLSVARSHPVGCPLCHREMTAVD
jgi:hypothetical protein